MSSFDEPGGNTSTPRAASRFDRDGNTEIYVMNADGSQPERLTNELASDFGPSWSPDGAQLVFSSERDGNFEVYVMAADGSDPTRLTDDPADDFASDWA